jgi:hypothetical protein
MSKNFQAANEKAHKKQGKRILFCLNAIQIENVEYWFEKRFFQAVGRQTEGKFKI